MALFPGHFHLEVGALLEKGRNSEPQPRGGANRIDCLSKLSHPPNLVCVRITWGSGFKFRFLGPPAEVCLPCCQSGPKALGFWWMSGGKLGSLFGSRHTSWTMAQSPCGAKSPRQAHEPGLAWPLTSSGAQTSSRAEPPQLPTVPLWLSPLQQEPCSCSEMLGQPGLAQGEIQPWVVSERLLILETSPKM